MSASVLSKLLGVAGVLLVASLFALLSLPLFDASAMIVTSGSMAPSIRAGDLVVVERIDPDEVRAGDVITYQGYGSDGLTTHRVLEPRSVEGRLHFQTKGDANDDPDPNLAPASGLFGRVRSVVPDAGRILHFLSTRTGKLVVIATPATLLLIGQLRRVLPSPKTWIPERLLATRVPPAHVIERSIAVSATIILLVALTSVVRTGTSAAVFTSTGNVNDNTFATVDVQPPTNVSATFDCGVLSVGKGIVVEWDAVIDADGYEVHRSTTSGGPYSLIASVDAASTSYKDTNIENNTTYHYVVRSTAGSWTSEYSTEVSETTPGSLSCLL